MVGVEPRVVRVVRAAVGREAGPTSVSKRLTVGEWADTLGRFRHALAAGAIYDRELVQLVEPLGSTRTLRRRIAAGLLPAFVSGRRTIRLKVEDVDRMMKPVIQGLMVG